MADNRDNPKCRHKKYHSKCRECLRSYLRQYYRKNKKRLLARFRELRKIHGKEYAAQKRKHYAQNRDEMLRRARAWRLANLETKRRLDKEYYHKNRSILLVKAKKYRESHLEQAAKRAAEWSKNHPEKRKEIWTKYNRSHPGNMTRWKKNNPEKAVALNAKIKSRRRNSPGSFDDVEWGKLVRFYAPRKICPACRHIRKMTVDHVVPVALGGASYIYNIQPLCLSCNCSKGDNIIDYRKDKGKFAMALYKESRSVLT